MEEKYNIRPVRVEDYVDLIKWWKSYKDIEVPTSDLLPNGGLGGLVIEKEGKAVIASFMYLTNSKMGYLDFLISDPNYKNKDKYNMIMKLQDACTEVLSRKGCRVVWAMTSYDHLAEMAEEMGHAVMKRKYHLIYTHEKVHKEITNI